MSKQLLFIIGVFFLFSTGLSAQHPDAPSAVSFNAVLFDYYSPSIDELFDDTYITAGAKIGYHRNLTKGFNLEIPLKLGTVHLPTPGGANPVSNNRTIIDLDAIVQMQLFKLGNVIVPYLTAGLGGAYIDGEDFDFQIPLGAGFDVKLFENFYLTSRSEYRVSFADERNNLNHHFGIKSIIDYGKKVEEPPMPVTPPDSDNDGVPDSEDECPTVAGPAALKGCPDSDGDQIIDKNDECPQIAGLPVFNGCPDTDSDGTPDQLDKCPEEAGPKTNQGCPIPAPADTDGDGLPDDRDACPSIPGTVENNGCPDTDGDGIVDPEDSCPNEAGPLSNNGCPIQEIKEEDQEILTFAARNIQFETNSSVIKTESFKILDQVADILRRYANFNCAINGHTDSTGRSDYNQQLSERRAKACYDYLQTKGVAASRMNYKGFGESQPIADNRTAVGQRLNRRVEFVLTPQ